MKRYILNFTLFFMAFVLNAWYSDTLFDLFLPLALLMFLAMFAWFVVNIFLIIKAIAKEQYLATMYGIALLAATVLLFLFFPFEQAKVWHDYKTMTPRRMEIVDKIIDGEIDDNPALVDLPVGYKSLSSDGTIFVYKNDDAGAVIGFWEFRGMMSGSRIVMYSSGGEDMIKESATGHPVVSVTPLGKDWFYVETVY